MSKTIKVIDLFNKIANGELKTGTKIVYKYMTFIYDYPNVEGIYLSGCKRSKENNIFSYIKTQDIKFSTVEIIEEQEEIDIQELKEYEFPGYVDIKLSPIEKKLLELINHNRQAVKQLDKKIKEK